MPVTPYYTNLFQKREDLYHLLANCRQVALAKNRKQILSISLAVDAIDPLAVLHSTHGSNQLHFYFEKRCQSATLQTERDRLAIAAIDTAVCLEIEGQDRFSQAQKFIQACLADTVTVGELNLPFTGPHFFCSFTFFEENVDRISPFPAATIFLPRWQVTRLKDKCVIVANLVIHPAVDIAVLLEDLWGDFQSITALKSYSPHLNIHHNNILNKRDVTDTNNFKIAVSAALESIQNNYFNKLVLAHAIDVTSPVPFHLSYSLNNLRQLYPDCYLFSTSNGKGQSFVGASPERLLSVYEHELVVDALAGSAPRGKTLIEDNDLASHLLGSEKEMREHQVVIDFITQRLMGLGFAPQPSSVPHLLQLSNIQHLRTLIRAEVPATIHPLEILAELHPTPAVAGAPRDIACQQIRRYEIFERSLYAAPLGWIDHKGNGEFIVGIRSALINGCQARLYAGAGIVAGSDPDKELAEIKLKLQALLAALI